MTGRWCCARNGIQPPGAQPVRNPVNVDMFELKAKLLKDWFESASVTQVAVD